MKSHSQPQPQPRASQPPTTDTRIPCDCGNMNAVWRGDRRGLRQYMCDDCAAAMIQFGKALAKEMLKD